MSDFFEGDLCINFPDSVAVLKFDDRDTHGLSHCMKAVDFIAETRSHVLYIEIKDPDHPSAHDADRNEFFKRFHSGNLDVDLVQKYRDTWLYRKFNAAAETKPILYLVLLGAHNLSSAELVTRTEAIRSKLPTKSKDGTLWTSFVDTCIVFNVAEWNENLREFPVRRLSSDAAR